ncbi:MULTISPECIES: hypothetical protein [unclassified Streptomyces]|uniref:hypothetical protein n=1 Tax=unclassified Streptomyces TaxID=2593676 RepID=UPI0033E1E190
MRARPGRGRPPRFTDTLRQRYLDAVTSGMYLKDAAAHVGISINTPSQHAHQDPAFAHALTHARALGRKARADAKPHDANRYDNADCRCPKCTRAASTARTGRRHRARTEPGDLVELDPPTGENASPFVLLRAS